MFAPPPPPRSVVCFQIYDACACACACGERGGRCKEGCGGTREERWRDVIGFVIIIYEGDDTVLVAPQKKKKNTTKKPKPKRKKGMCFAVRVCVCAVCYSPTGDCLPTVAGLFPDASPSCELRACSCRRRCRRRGCVRPPPHHHRHRRQRRVDAPKEALL